jgi:hypothetical protein
MFFEATPSCPGRNLLFSNPYPPVAACRVRGPAFRPPSLPSVGHGGPPHHPTVCRAAGPVAVVSHPLSPMSKPSRWERRDAPPQAAHPGEPSGRERVQNSLVFATLPCQRTATVDNEDGQLSVPSGPYQPATTPNHNAFISPYRYHTAIHKSSPHAIQHRALCNRGARASPTTHSRF